MWDEDTNPVTGDIRSRSRLSQGASLPGPTIRKGWLDLACFWPQNERRFERNGGNSIMPRPILNDDGSRLPAWRVAEIEDAAEEAKFSVWRAWDILGEGKPCDEGLRNEALRALSVALVTTTELAIALGGKRRRH